MRYRFKGLKEYIQKLERLSNPLNAEACVEIAVDEGSAVVADYTVNELKGMPTDDRPGKLPQRNGIRSVQKKFLIDEFGVSPLENKNGLINRKTGVDRGVLTYKNDSGYTPAVVLARSLERGTSFMPRNPVFTRASRKARTPCLKAIEKSLNESIEAICANNFKRSRRNGKW